MTWREGRLGSIAGWIAPWKKPVLIKSGTPKSGGDMPLDATDIEHGGMRVRGGKKDLPLKETRAWSDESAARQEALGQPAPASESQRDRRQAGRDPV